MTSDPQTHSPVNGEEKSAGWLIAAIENEYGFRKGFKSSAQRKAEAAKKAQKQKELANAKAQGERRLREQRSQKETARERFLEFRARFSETQRIALGNQALAKCTNKLVREFVIRDRRERTIGSWHQIL